MNLFYVNDMLCLSLQVHCGPNGQPGIFGSSGCQLGGGSAWTGDGAVDSPLYKSLRSSPPRPEGPAYLFIIGMITADAKHPGCDQSYIGCRGLLFTLENDIYRSSPLTVQLN
ncbi:uncharacterized protein [Lolium perenne]|uniref:uncharacterized protein isoform X1 n=1 Tax=Lolium perenne TaxID=4522 RepID=UPI003A98F429